MGRPTRLGGASTCEITQNYEHPANKFHFHGGKEPSRSCEKASVACNNAKKSPSTRRNSKARSPAHDLLYPKDSATRRVAAPPHAPA